MIDNETRILGMHADYESLKIKFSKLQSGMIKVEKEIEFIVNNLIYLSDHLRYPLRVKTVCDMCNGTGKLYISPISDCGQDNTCLDCKSTGFLWK
jgi:DnaJ-class molecular chaperone